jgi:hypothetical protein
MNATGPSKTAALVVALLFLLFLGWRWLAAHLTSRPMHAPSATIANNLQLLDMAKKAWAMERYQTNGALLTPADLAPYLKNGELPRSVAGETYTITPVGELNTATLTRKIARWEAGQVLTVTNF